MNTATQSSFNMTQWSLPPTAHSLGPFPNRAMAAAWWEFDGSGELAFTASKTALLPLVRTARTFRFIGPSGLFDYHSPLGDSVDDLTATWAAGLADGDSIDFDSLPGTAADELMRGLSNAGVAAVASVHETAAVLDLPSSYDDYLGTLSKKQRHEARRKHRRFEECLGPARIERRSGPDAVAEFARMHRLSSNEKGDFMTQQLEDYFLQLHVDVNATVDFLVGENGNPVAVAFGFEDATTYYLYNSAYHPDWSGASPGIVLVSELTRSAIESGRSRFDFLKGEETYKYKLGATARPLWRIEATIGDTG